MKKSIKFIAAAFAIVAAASCAKDSSFDRKSPVTSGEEFTFTASIGSDTKMTVDAEGKCAWSVGDIVIVYNGNNTEDVIRTEVSGADTFVSDNIQIINVTEDMLSSDNKTLEISTTLAAPADGTWYFYAVDNMTNLSSINADAGVVAEPVDKTTQTAVPFTATASCSSTATSVSFKHALAYLKMTASSQLYKVTVVSNSYNENAGASENNEAILQSQNIALPAGTTSPRVDKNDNEYVASVDEVPANSAFYVALTPHTWEDGISLGIYCGASEWAAGFPSKDVSTTKSFTAVAGHVYNMGDILVEHGNTPVEEVTVGFSKFLTAVGKTINLEGFYTVLPENASNKTVVFSSSDTSIASVSSEGVITANATGDATITIAAEDDDTKSTTVIVRVTEIPEYAAVTKSTPVTIENCDALTYMTKLGTNNTARAVRDTVVDGTTVSCKEGNAFFFNKSEKNKGRNEWMVSSRAKAPADGKILGANRAHLTFWFYASNNGGGKALADRLTYPGGHIEITSTGNNSRGPYWTTEEVLKSRALQDNGSYGKIKTGWNLIDLPFISAFHNATENTLGDGFLNTKNINYFRFYIHNSNAANLYDEFNYGFDNIAIYEDYTQETTAEKKYLHTLDNLSGFSSAYYNADEQAVGTKFSTGIQVFQLTLSEPVASGTTKRNGHVHFKMYVSDVTTFSGSGQFELTSSGKCDNQEISWSVGDVAKCLHNGWNDVVLDFNRSSWSDEFNPENVNFFRFYDNLKNPVTIQFKDIYLFNETFDK